MNTPLPRAARVLEIERLERAAAAVGQELTVFVAGPFINVAKPAPRGKNNSAARLRHFLYHDLSARGVNVTLGEFGELTDAHKAGLGQFHNAAYSEIGHAEKVADAIIMLPSSPGSFLELGAFSLYEEISKKMLIIIDKQYEEKKGYLHFGPLLGAQGYRAEVAFEDYSDQCACKSLVDKFTLMVSQKKVAKGYLPK